MQYNPQSNFRVNRKILVTGPESTGKSELSSWLAATLGGKHIPEYAREYIGTLSRNYSLEDVKHIAKEQIFRYHDTQKSEGLIIFDTWLIITKVWFDVVFSEIPSWVEESLQQADFDLVLLCAPDLEWVPDPLRENGGERRTQLFERYKQELEHYRFPWRLVSGFGDDRRRMALEFIQSEFR
jgi:nicotinamide riboside kinase